MKSLVEYAMEYEQALLHFNKALKEAKITPEQYSGVTNHTFGVDPKMDDLWHTRRRIMDLQFFITKLKQETK